MKTLAAPHTRSRGFLLRSLLLILLINTVIGLFIAVTTGQPVGGNMVVAHAIGLSIYALFTLAHVMRGWDARLPLPLQAGLVVGGALLGLVLSEFLAGPPILSDMRNHPRIVAVVLANVVVFGIAVSYYFESRHQMALAWERLQAEQLQNAESARQMAEVRLKLLQAQIEPHFLFNTLSNVVSLIDSAPDQAKLMLEKLTRYLRVGLHRTRLEESTLAEELALLEAYLGIQAIRMGPRLRYTLPDPGALAQVPIPPLLIQPLVENAVIHGLEPQIAGGRIEIACRRQDGRLVIDVTDTGGGLEAEVGQGVGLRNVRERLQGRYGDAARLTLRQNQPAGVVATLELPLSAPPAQPAS